MTAQKPGENPAAQSPLHYVSTPAPAPEPADTAAAICAFYDRRGESVLRAAGSPFASRYDDFVGRATRVFMESALPPAREGSKLLDLCCGSGSFSIYPAKMGYQVWGVDLSPLSIAAAREEARRNGAENCAFQICDAFAFLHATQEKFDVISICGSLYYLNREETLALIRERLAPSGRFLCLETSGSNALINVYRRLKNLVKRNRDQQTLHHLLRHNDFTALASFFDAASLHYFDLFTLATPLFRWNRSLANRYYYLARRLDAFVLHRGMFCYWAFKTVVVATKASL